MIILVWEGKQAKIAHGMLRCDLNIPRTGLNSWFKYNAAYKQTCKPNFQNDIYVGTSLLFQDGVWEWSVDWTFKYPYKIICIYCMNEYK